MARRRSPEGGVGRGNGTGSQRTQFKPGMPSGNPKGRPRRPRVPPTASFKGALVRYLAEEITTTENGTKRKRPRSEAMIMSLLADYPQCDPREKLAMLKYVGGLAPEAELTRNRDLPADAIQDLVNRLADESLYADDFQAQTLAAKNRGEG